MLGKHSTTEQHYPGPAPFKSTFVVIWYYYAFETVSLWSPGSSKRYYVADVPGDPLALPPKCWFYRCEPPNWPPFAYFLKNYTTAAATTTTTTTTKLS